MTSRRFLFDVLTGSGHVTPTLALVAELIRRGHRVDYATSEEHAAAVRAAGAHWVPLPTFPPPPQPEVLDAAVYLRFLRHYFAAMRATYPVLLEHCARQRPDVLCRDATNWPGRLVAAELGIADACTFPHLASNAHFSLDERVGRELGGAELEAEALAGPCAEFAAEYGVPLTPAELSDVPAALNLAFYPRRFQPHGAEFDERFAFVGPQLGAREVAEPWAPADPDTPLLYVSLGSFFTDPAFYRTCIEAFGTGGWQVAMNIGGVDPAELGSIPSTVELRSWFPQPAVLGGARAFVTHAGMNSTMEALYYGVPLVTVPWTPEQRANAERVSELGLGVRLEPGASAAELRSAARHVATDPGIRERIAAMRAATREAGGAARAADELLALSG